MWRKWLQTMGAYPRLARSAKGGSCRRIRVDVYSGPRIVRSMQPLRIVIKKRRPIPSSFPSISGSTSGSTVAQPEKRKGCTFVLIGLVCCLGSWFASSVAYAQYVNHVARRTGFSTASIQRVIASMDDAKTPTCLSGLVLGLIAVVLAIVGIASGRTVSGSLLLVFSILTLLMSL